MTDNSLPSTTPPRDIPEGTLHIRFHGTRIAGDILAATFSSIENTIKQEEEEELHSLCASLNLPDFIADASMYRLRKNEIERYYITAAQSGSIQITVVVVAVVYYVLERTISESVKAGYLDSQMHAKLKALVANLIDTKLSRLAHHLPKQYRSPAMLVKMDPDARVLRIDLDGEKAPAQLPEFPTTRPPPSSSS